MPLKGRKTVSYAQQASASTSARVQDRFPAYADFPWEEVQRYLDRRFPGWTEYNPERVHDQWQFEVPERLTDDDRRALRRLRDEYRRTQRDSVTPE